MTKCECGDKIKYKCMECEEYFCYPCMQQHKDWCLYTPESIVKL